MPGSSAKEVKNAIIIWFQKITEIRNLALYKSDFLNFEVFTKTDFIFITDSKKENVNKNYGVNTIWNLYTIL